MACYQQLSGNWSRWEVIARLTPLALRKLKLTARTKTLTLSGMRLAFLCLLASAVFPAVSRAEPPVFKITPEDSSIKFSVKASVAIDGTFDKWDATLTFASTDEEAARLNGRERCDYFLK